MSSRYHTTEVKSTSRTKKPERAVVPAYKEQSALSAKYERRYRRWKTFTLIGIPAAVILSGGLTALALSAR